MRSACLIAMLLWGAGAPTTPQAQARLTGRVLDHAGRPVGGADVIVNRGEVRAMTDSAGIFSLAVSPDDSTVGFRRIGYRPAVFMVRPLPPPGDTVLIELVASPINLPQVSVSAAASKPLRYAGTAKYDEVFLRERVGLGTLISRDAIASRFSVPTYELLRGVAGLRIWNGPPKRLRFARCSEPGGIAIFIDGTRQIPSSASGATPGNGGGLIMPGSRPRSAAAGDEPEIEILSRVSPADIEMIEVFRGVSEIPGVFHWNGCAVIAIWTRWND